MLTKKILNSPIFASLQCTTCNPSNQYACRASNIPKELKKYFVLKKDSFFQLNLFPVALRPSKSIVFSFVLFSFQTKVDSRRERKKNVEKRKGRQKSNFIVSEKWFLFLFYCAAAATTTTVASKIYLLAKNEERKIWRKDKSKKIVGVWIAALFVCLNEMALQMQGQPKASVIKIYYYKH